jgi:hypothetical protein
MPGWYAAAYGENGSTRGKGIPLRYVVARFAGSEGPEGLLARFGGVVWRGSGRFGGAVRHGSAARFGAVRRGGSVRFGGAVRRRFGAVWRLSRTSRSYLSASL